MVTKAKPAKTTKTVSTTKKAEAKTTKSTGYALGKAALRQENELLKILLDATNTYIKTLPAGSVGLMIAKDWRGTFRQLPALNQELIDASPTDYLTMLDEEIDASKDFLRFVRRSKMGDSWKKYFRGEIKIAEELKKG